MTIRSYPTAAEAYIARDMLRNEGIIAEVVGGLSMLYAPVPSPTGGYDLTIFRRDAERASELLSRHDD